MRLIVVDPQNDPRLVNWITTKSTADNKVPFNWFSMLEFGYRIDNLAPIKELLPLLKEDENGDINTVSFDNQYAFMIMNRNEIFIDFMKLMSRVIDDEDTVLISNYNHPNIMPIVDSLLKLIQQRYGINAFVVNTIDDLESIHLKYNEFGSREQQMVYAADVERYMKLTKQAPQANPKEVAEDTQSMYDSMAVEMPLLTQQVPDIKL